MAFTACVSKNTLRKLGGRANEHAAGKVSDWARKQLEKHGWKR